MEDHGMACDHRLAIEKMNRALELNNQLRVLILHSIPVVDGSTGRQIKLVEDMFKETRSCFASALSKLQASGSGSGSLTGGHSDAIVESLSPGLGKRKHSDGRWVVDSSRIRRKKNSWFTVTAVPYEDGYQWSKYGQKDIKGHKYPRSYYRCTYSKEEGCAATKSVQQDSEENPAKFIVSYGAQHTFKAMADTRDHYLVESNTDVRHRPSEALNAVQAHDQEQYHAISLLPLEANYTEQMIDQERKCTNLITDEQTADHMAKLIIENNYDCDSLSYWTIMMDDFMFAGQTDI